MNMSAQIKDYSKCKPDPAPLQLPWRTRFANWYREWKLEGQRKQALVDLMTRRDNRLLIDAGLERDRPAGPLHTTLPGSPPDRCDLRF